MSIKTVVSSKSSGKPLGKNNDAWRQTLENAQINDDNWKTLVVMLVPAGSELEFAFIQTFEKVAIERNRFVIVSISKSETLFMINQYNPEKSETYQSKLYETAQEISKNNKGKLPPDLLALIIKNKILQIKNEDLAIKLQKSQLSEGLKQESQILFEENEVTSLLKSSAGGVATDKKKTSKKSTPQDIVPNKFNTELRERGEEWRDNIYIEDFPVDGPDLYITLSGFIDPYLPLWLLRYGVPFHALVQIKSDQELFQSATGVVRKPKRIFSDHDPALSEKFWAELSLLKNSPSTMDVFQKTAFLTYSPDTILNVKSQSNISSIYDEMSFLLYDLQDLKRQHENYLDSMIVTNIEDEEYNDNIFKCYLSLVDAIPIECVSESIVLGKIVETVDIYGSVLSDIISQTSKNLSQESSSDIPQHERIVKDVFKILTSEPALVTKDCSRTFSLKSIDDIPVIYYNDKVRLNTFHLDTEKQEANSNIVLDMLTYFPVKLWKKVPCVPCEEIIPINYHLKTLMNCFSREDVQYSELEKMIHLSLCKLLFDAIRTEMYINEKIKSQKNLHLKRTSNVHPLTLSDSSSSVKDYEGVISLQTTTSPTFDGLMPELCNRDILMLEQATFDCFSFNELIYFQNNTFEASLQELNEALQAFRFHTSHYCKLTDSIILVFFNNFDKARIYSNQSHLILPTPVCFKDFFEYVFDEKYDWLIKQEELYDIQFRQDNLNSVLPSFEPFSDTTCLDSTDLENELLLEGSIKQSLVTKTVSDSSVSIAKGKKKGEKNRKSVVESKTSKSGKPAKSQSSIKIDAVTPNSVNQEEQNEKPFLGYNIGENRFEIIEKETCFYSVDGKQIKTKVLKSLATMIEYLSLEWKDTKSDITLTLHCAQGNFTNTLPEKMMIQTPDHILISLFKDNNDNENILKCNIGWPNGLLVETIFAESNKTISHILQSYTHFSPVIGNESKRAVTKNGEVIVFFESGEIKIYKPNGSVTHIMSYHVEVQPEELILEPEILVAVKNKNKSKMKSSKSKSVSKEFSEIETVIKPPEKKVVLKEYCVSKPSGHKKIYIDGCLNLSEHYHIRTATDYNNGEVFVRRNDGVQTLLNHEGHFTVEFDDGTFIRTQYVEYEAFFEEITDTEVEETSEPYIFVDLIFIAEHKNYAKITINKHTDEITVNNPSDVTVTIVADCLFRVDLYNMTTIVANQDELKIMNTSCNCNGCDIPRSETTIDFNFILNSTIGEKQYILQMTDASGQIFIDYKGHILTEQVLSDLVDKYETDEFFEALDNDKGLRPARTCWHFKGLRNTPRFFVLKRDLTTLELVSMNELNEYRGINLQKPWSLESFFDVLKGNRKIKSIQVPLFENPREFWTMPASLRTKPKNLTHEKLNRGKDNHYKWFRPYGVFVPSTLCPPDDTPKIPCAFVTRNLERQWVDGEGCLRGLFHFHKALRKYKEVMQGRCQCVINNGCDIDVTAEELVVEENIQNMAYNMREDMIKNMGSNLKREFSFKRKENEETCVSEASSVAAMSGNLKKYWQRRAALDRQQEYFRQIINTGPIPPYFEGLFGGAVWLLLHELLEYVMDIGDGKKQFVLTAD